jgi:hypothetical protein
MQSSTLMNNRNVAAPARPVTKPSISMIALILLPLWLALMALGFSVWGYVTVLRVVARGIG